MSDKLARRPRTWGRPLKIHLEVNDVCNLKCIHCPREDPTIPKNTGHMAMEVVESLRESFRHAAYVGLIGNGEPFLHPKLMEIIEIVASEGAVPSIISNATLWTDEKLRRLIGVGRSIMNVSFDGGTPATFEKIRKPAKFDQVTTNMRRLRELKEEMNSPYPVVNLISCLMQDTVEETEQVVEIAADAGAHYVHFQVAIAYAEAIKPELLAREDKQRAEAAVERARRRGAQLGVQVHFHSQWDEAERRETGKGLLCPNIMEQLHIDMHGNPRFCCYWGKEDLGNVKDTSAEILWNQPAYVALRRRFQRGDVPKLCTAMPCPNLRPHNRREIIGEAWRLAKEAWAD